MVLKKNTGSYIRSINIVCMVYNKMKTPLFLDNRRKIKRGLEMEDMNTAPKKLVLLIVCVSIIIALPGAGRADVNLPEVLEVWLTSTAGGGSLCVGCSQIPIPSEIREYYAGRSFKPVWSDEAGVDRLAFDYIEELSQSDIHGLTAEDYYYGCLRKWAEKQIAATASGGSPPLEETAAMEILLTSSFYRYGRHLAYGMIKSDASRSAASSMNNDIDILKLLNDLELHRDVNAALRLIAPPHPDYWLLAETGAKLKRIIDSGGWPQLSRKALRLKKGKESEEVGLLRKRLLISGDMLFDNNENNMLFDDDAEIALKMFQARHGLEESGEVDSATLRELNVPAEKRYWQVLANLERLRWLPHNLGDRYVVVNIASFTLKAFDEGREALEMRVVIGKPQTKTPVFSDTIEYVEINPWWYVPTSILPEINRDNLARKGYETVGETGIRQRPGPGNALGNIKFIFPNHYNVYLHDTPSKSLFKRNYRAYSHGCVRVEKPLDLALFLLKDNPEWDAEKIKKQIKTRKTARISINQLADVHLTYLTAWVGEEGELQFRNDLYRRDHGLAKTIANRQTHRTSADSKAELQACRQISASPRVTYGNKAN